MPESEYTRAIIIALQEWVANGYDNVVRADGATFALRFDEASGDPVNYGPSGGTFPLTNSSTNPTYGAGGWGLISGAKAYRFQRADSHGSSVAYFDSSQELLMPSGNEDWSIEFVGDIASPFLDNAFLGPVWGNVTGSMRFEVGGSPTSLFVDPSIITITTVSGSLDISSTFTTGSFHHCVLTYQGSTRLFTAYVDGAQVWQGHGNADMNLDPPGAAGTTKLFSFSALQDFYLSRLAMYTGICLDPSQVANHALGDGATGHFTGVPGSYVEVAYDSLEFTLRYWDTDYFKLVCGGGAAGAQALRAGALLWLPDENDLIFSIESVETEKDGESMVDSHVIAMGKSFEGIALDQRIALPVSPATYDSVSGVPAETAMKHFVNNHAGPSAPAARQVPFLHIATDLGRGATVSLTGRFQTISALLKQIGLASGMGWQIALNPGTFNVDFDVLVGVDHSTDVFFSFNSGSIDSWDDLVSLINAVTVAYVGGGGPGATRDLVVRYGTGAEPTGMARREQFLAAVDIKKGDITHLDLRGDALLQAKSIQRQQEVIISSDSQFQFGVDYQLGDFVLVEDDETGVREKIRVTAVTKIYDESGAAPRVIPQIGNPFPTIGSAVAASPAGAGGGTSGVADTGTIIDGSVTLASLGSDVLAVLAAASVEILVADGSADFLTLEDGSAFLYNDS